MSYAYGSTNSNEFMDNQQQNSPSSSNHSSYGPMLGGQRDYPSPAPSMSSMNAPSPSAYSFPEGQLESSIGPCLPNRIMTRGQRKAAMNAGRVKPSSRSQTPHSNQGYPLTPDSLSSASVAARQLSASPALSSISSHSQRSQRLIQQQQYRMSMSPASPAMSPATYSFHLPGPQLLPSTITQPPPPPPHHNIIPRPYVKAKQRKQRLFNIDRKAICEYHLAHPNEKQELIARQYGVERSTISKILKHKEKWLNAELDDARGCGTNGTGMPLRLAKHRPSKFPPVEFEMQQWLMVVSDKYYGTLPDPSSYPFDPHNAPLHGPLSDASLREKALSIARSHGITPEQFKASSGWVENFKHRHGIKNGFWGGYLRNVQGRNAFAGLSSTNPAPAPPPLASALASKLPSKEYVRYPVRSVKTAPQEDDESDSEDDEDDEANMDSGYRQPPSALSHLRDSAFSRPPWSTDSASTSGSGESLLSPHPNQSHHHAYSSRPPWSSGSTASHSSTPTEPLLEQHYRRPNGHRRSVSGLSVATMDVSAPASPYAHSQSRSEHIQHSHIQSTTDHHMSHGQRHGHHAQNMVAEPQVQHQEQVHYAADPNQTRYTVTYTTSVDHGVHGGSTSSAVELSSYSSQYPASDLHAQQNQDGQNGQTDSYRHQAGSMEMESSSHMHHAPPAEYQHIHPEVQMHGVLEAPAPPPPHLMDNSVPTLAEVEHFLTRILLFADTPRSQGGGGGPDPILSDRRRDWLTKLKVVFFEAGSGIPITPDSDEEKSR
ncbi:hypothetical protein BT96DRAFT_989715 [Gymnopus androsaceus JB14]|uniref:HTH CENPB-type domain-containing protein n=1 Tax=Gymnopus androsaceus JB14 TaxID=1447944 RepID=A0A6A4I0F5_9AGAR|nr:hypothetical protein BT96DRAFT_989715 [Gymnopus androsaceus JB14]